MWFIKFIIVLLVLYLLGYLMFRYVIPWLLKRWIRKAAQRMNPDYHNQMEKDKRKVGEINIDYIPTEKDSKDDDKDDGEYVDYEEVK